MTDNDVYLQSDFARFYDWIYANRDEDIDFYRRITSECGSPVLEVACGTGRLLVALARSGAEAVGVDFSEHMLAYARAKLDAEPEPVRGRASLLQADMRSFDLGRAFAAVCVPQASVFHLRARDEVLQCFTCLRRHTRRGGRVAIDVVAPHRMADQAIGPRVKIRESINPGTGLLTQELNRKLTIDPRSQTVRVEHTYVEAAGAHARELVFEQDYRWLERDEGIGLLEEAGFANVDPLGDYDGSPFCDGSPRLILVGTPRAQEGDA